MTPRLELAGISLDRSGVRLLEDIDLRLEAGAILALTGPSGSGKTTLLRTIVGLETPSRGQVSILGRTVAVAGRTHVAAEGRNVGMVFQDLGLWPHMSIREHMHFVLQARRTSKAGRAASVRQALASVGLDGREHQRPATLSGGERQRLAIARALVADPSIFLLDEPFSNLDVVLKRELIALLSTLLKNRETTSILVTHDPREALPLTSDFAVMEQGRIVQRGTLADLAHSPATAFIRALASEAGHGH
jgi:ABC-type Fe3+/spermidine/putrescine transport system ATPase subunit